MCSLWKVTKRRASVFVCVLFLAAPQLGAGLTWVRHANCTAECDVNSHRCLSTVCTLRWDNCTAGADGVSEIDTRQEMVIDRQQCYDNGCDNSGCDGGAGYEEVESRWCSNLPQLCPLCKQETCCLRRPQLLCCQLLDCIEDRADCRVPQQRYLGGPNTSKSDVYFTNLAHGGTAVFPFYSQPLLPYGSSCESVRVMGLCHCLDGSPSPGCTSSDSSSWLAQDPEAPPDTLQPLPPGLSLTCLVAPPPQLPPPSPSPSPAPAPFPAPFPPSLLPAAQPDAGSAQAAAAAQAQAQASADGRGGSASASASASSSSGGEGGSGGGEGVRDEAERVAAAAAGTAVNDEAGGQSSRALSGGAIAGIAIGSSGGLALLVLAVVRASRAARAGSWARTRRAAAYQPVLTGQLQSSPLQAAPKAHNTLVQRLVQRLRSAWQRLPRPPPRPLSVTAPRWPEVQVRLGAAAFSSGPALPPEVEDELYTLQDIEEEEMPPAFGHAVPPPSGGYVGLKDSQPGKGVYAHLGGTHMKGQHEVELGSSSQPLGKPHKPLLPDSKPGPLPYSSSSEYMYGPGQATVGAYSGNSGMWPGAQGQQSGDSAHVQAGALYRQEGSGGTYQGSSRGLQGQQGQQGAGLVLDPDAILTHQVPFRPATPTQSATPLEPGAMAGRAGEEGAGEPVVLAYTPPTPQPTGGARPSVHDVAGGRGG
ncbi:hypothetical protein V8C86DRAFT_2511349 [Haematococcus lacustris]